MSSPGPATPTLARQYATYMLGVFFQKVAGFALIPLYTTRLSTADYGVLELMANLAGLTSLFVAFGVPGAINKCYQRDCRGEAERQELVGTSILFTLPVAFLIAVTGFLFDERIARLIFARPDWAPYVRLTLVLVALMQTAQIPMELLRTLGRAGMYVGISLLQMAVQAGLSIWLLVSFDLGVMGVLVANVASYAAIQLATVGFVLRRTRLRFDWRLFRALAGFGLLMIPIAVCGWIINVSDRWFLQRLASDAEVGLYALGYKFGTLIELAIVLPFQKAWNPHYFAIAENTEARVVYARVITHYVALISLGVALLSVCGSPLVRLMASPEFQSARRVIPLIALSYALSGLVMCLSTGLIVSGKARVVTLVAVVGAALNVALNLLLIPRHGMMGAAASTVLTFAVTAALTAWAMARWYPIRIEARRLGIAVFGAGVLSLLASAIGFEQAPLEIAVRAMVVLSLPLMLLATGYFSAEELGFVRAAALRATSIARASRAH